MTATQGWWEDNMTHARTITIRAVLGAMLGIACLAPVPTMAQGRDMGCSPTLVNPCSGGGGGSSGGYSAPSYDYGAARRAQEAAEAAAAAERQHRQEEADRLERERLAAEQRKKEKEAAFIRDRDAAANTLKGSSGSAMSQLKGLAGADSSGLKGSGFDQGGQLKSAPGADTSVVDNRNEPAGLGGKSDFKGAFAKPAPTVPSGDPMVVDARNVPSGLPKALDSAIATAYSTAPPGVSDRVRKGFQAVMDRDWKVAKAWFEDALNRDPNNAGLKRMIVLTEYSLRERSPVASIVTSSVPAVKKSVPTKAEIDEFFRNFREGRKFTPTDKVRNHVLSMSNEEFKNRIWESPLQLPQDSDITYLFDLK